MALVNMKEMLNVARRARRAVGAFNVTNYETAVAVIVARVFFFRRDSVNDVSKP